MADNHRTTGQQKSQSQPLVSIYWDYQNISNYKRAKDLLLFASGLGCVVNRKVYNYWEKQNKEAKETLRCLDFEFVHEPVKSTGAVDFNLFGECYSEASSSLYPHTFIIVSGEGYGEILIRKLHEKGKKVIIVARKGNDSHNLKKLGDGFYLVDELQKSIETYKLTA